jgi:parallel beta-helix repeat protein
VARVGLAEQPQRAEIRVGIDAGDIRGSDGRAIQAAIDYVAGLGGGTVRIGPGRYELRNALMLRDHVTLAGSPGETILVACEGVASKLTLDGDANERQITVADPGAFRVGDGVSVQDKDNGGGFAVTTATLTAQTGPASFRLSQPLYLDYLVSGGATAKLAFPLVGGWQVKDAVVEGLTLEGNREKAQNLNGCRGGGIYLFECERVAIRNCTVRGYNGDGISFQVSAGVTVEDCLVEKNAGLGIHPGSGSTAPIVRRCRSLNNGSDGLFVCWRVTRGLFEDNEIRGNERAGVSIGHKDTDNLFRRNTIVQNLAAGVLFRNESEAMGAHRNVFEDNRILDNAADAKRNPAAAIVVQGPHHDVVFRNNTIGFSQPQERPAIGILLSNQARNLQADEAQFQNVKTAIEIKK